MVIDPTRARLLRDMGDGDGEDRAAWVARAGSAHLQSALDDDLPAQADGARDTGPVHSRAALDRDAEEFLDQTLGFLATERRAQRFDRLAIFAEPAIYALVALKLPSVLRPGLILQRARGLMRLPEPSLRRRLHEMIDQSNGTNHAETHQ
jgi:hypothetical protein